MSAGPLETPVAFGADHESLLTKGYTVRPFTDPGSLGEIAGVCNDVLGRYGFAGDLTSYHERVPDRETHLRVVRSITDALHAGAVLERLFRPERDFIVSLLGPDVMVQAAPHLRVGRAGEETDGIGLHRDSFYGSSAYHLNFWFPLAPLPAGSGIYLAEGTHREPSLRVRDQPFDDSFRSTVKRGSLAHGLGFVYQPRTDDTIAALTPDRLTLVAPPLNSFVVFFGCMVHGGSNAGAWTRWTMDVRFSNMNDGSAVRPGYFREFSRGVVSRVAQAFAPAA
ncbi:hypothetical protein VT84_14565 [Gemmata sp. SH-PL17]|uniref:hypothetical protein n=1 Tax=Gemmata sp. SH-PL17 TaxID=1630693 RepID=UPI00078E8CE0|nr:hypothetical protein [Gemmata sp. SH-PL17]AMV25617.1 hypothetical protein VT84_14565 [Gemmata sp. SH-PL17]